MGTKNVKNGQCVTWFHTMSSSAITHASVCLDNDSRVETVITIQKTNTCTC